MNAFDYPFINELLVLIGRIVSVNNEVNYSNRGRGGRAYKAGIRV